MTSSPPDASAAEVPAALQQERDRAADVQALAGVRAHIGAHLQATQGVFRQTSAPARFWPLALACVAMCALVPIAARGHLSLASGAAIGALVLGGVTVALVPFWPGRAELLSRAALVIAVAAGASELARALGSASSDPGRLVHCATSVLLAATLPGLFLAVFLVALARRPAAGPARLTPV